MASTNKKVQQEAANFLASLITWYPQIMTDEDMSPSDFVDAFNQLMGQARHGNLQQSLEKLAKEVHEFKENQK